MEDAVAKLNDLERRLRAVETRLGLATTAAPPPPPPYGVAPPPPAHVAEPGRSVEETIGRWWLGVVGVVAITFGVSFFLKYAFENNLIGVTGRVVLGFTAGLLFVALGEVLRSRLAKYAQILTGAGLGLFYLTTYAAFAYYHLIGQPTAFVFMCLVTAFGVALSLWPEAVGVAALATAGGFLTPSLLSTGTPQDVSFFLYLTVLNLGVLAVSFFKKWNELIVVGFIGTLVNFTSWYVAYYDDSKLAFSVYILTTLFITYLVSSVAANVRATGRSEPHDLAILTVNPAWYFGWLYYLLTPRHVTLGFVAAALAAAYLGVAYVAALLRRENSRLVLFLAAIALLFTTLAAPLLFDQNAITIAWAAEAAILYALGVKLREANVRLAAFVVLGVAVVRLLALDSTVSPAPSFTPFFNRRFFTYLAGIAAASVMGTLAIRHAATLGQNERGTRPVLWLTANALLLIGVTLDIGSLAAARQEALRLRLEADYARRTPLVEQTRYGYARSYVNPATTSEYRSIRNQRNATMSVFWTLYAIALVAAGIVLRHAYLRWAALALFGFTVVKVFTVDLAGLETLYRIISFLVLGCILLATSYLYFRYEQAMRRTP